MAVLSSKKVLVVAFLKAVLFVASLVVSNRINAYHAFCGAASGIWSPIIGAPECGPTIGGQRMVASYYGYELAGNPTASGEPFIPQAHTAAHRTMPLGTRLLVDYGGNSTVVTVNDRGPFTDGRDLDLSQGAAETIGLTEPGVAPVDVDVLPR